MEDLAPRGAVDGIPPAETTILVVDHHRSFADLLFPAINLVPGMRCVGTAASASEGVAFALKLRPNIVVMDIQMPGQDGLLATRQILDNTSDTAVAVVTAHCDPVWISRAAQAGASAFIVKDGSLSEMIDVLGRVTLGRMIVAPAALRAERTEPRWPAVVALPALTPRELDVLRYLGQGMQTSGIAQVLGITVHTCRSYLKALHSKLGATSRLEAVIKAQQLGLINAS